MRDDGKSVNDEECDKTLESSERERERKKEEKVKVDRG